MSNVKNNTALSDLTSRDVEMLVAAMRCVEGGFPKIDWKKFAEMAGFKNAHSASVSFQSVKRKIMDQTGSANPTPKKAAPKKPTPSKRKQATFAPVDDDDSEESPTKKAKPTPKKVAKKEESDGEGSAFV